MLAIDRDIKPYLKNQFNFGIDEVIYSVVGVDEKLRFAIRSDPKVKFVEHDVKGHGE